MHLRLTVAALMAMIVVLLSASAGLAATRYVDDDRAQCTSAPHQSIEQAVDAAAPGDVVRVCAGVYRGQVNVDTDRVSLISQPRHAAVIAAPLSLPRLPHALLVVNAHQVRIAGFEFVGPLPDVSQEHCDSHLHAAAIAVPQGSAVIQRNRFTLIGDFQDCASGAQQARAVHTGDVDASFGFGSTGPTLIDRNVIDGSGVLAEASFVRVVNNTIRGPGATGVTFAESGGADVRGNDISGQIVGVRAGQHTEGGYIRVRGNHLHHNTYGVRVTSSSGIPPLIERNIARFNDYGLFVSVFTAPGDAILRNNLARDNRVFDCFDEIASDPESAEAPAGIWRNNRGVTSNPAQLCRPPGGSAATQAAGPMTASTGQDNASFSPGVEHHHGR